MSIKVDPNMVKDLKASGLMDVNRCYHCGNCSSACPLSTPGNTFPRKIMKYAQMGLVEKIKEGPEPWLCYQCNDCSIQCPRGANPGDTMAAIRKQALVEYGSPKFLAKLVGSGSMLKPMLLAIAILALTLVVRAPLEAVLKPALEAFAHFMGMHPHEGAVVYANFFPHWLLIGLFTGATMFTMISGLFGVRKFWGTMAEADKKKGLTPGGAGVIGSLIKVLPTIISHKDFGECDSAAPRKTSHLLLVVGFVILFIVTTYAVISLYLLKVYPFDLVHPAKIMGNLGGIALTIGVIIMMINRKNNPEQMGTATGFDWSFLWVILGVGITGFLAQFLRFAGNAPLAYTVYFIHLIFVFYLLVFLPYSKFGHLLYRTAAIAYAEYSGRNSAAPTIPDSTPATSPAADEKPEEKAEEKKDA